MKATAMIHMRLVVAGIAILLLAVSPAEQILTIRSPLARIGLREDQADSSNN